MMQIDVLLLCSVIMNGNIEEAKDFRASHEEADDRIIYIIHKIYQKTSDKCCLTVVPDDADIFVTLLYHLKNNWHGLELGADRISGPVRSGIRLILTRSGPVRFYL